MQEAQEILAKFLLENDAPLNVIQAWNHVLMAKEVASEAIRQIRGVVEKAAESIESHPINGVEPEFEVNPYYVPGYFEPVIQIARQEADEIEYLLRLMNSDGLDFYQLRDNKPFSYHVELACDDREFLTELVKRINARTNETGKLWMQGTASRIAEWAEIDADALIEDEEKQTA